MFLATEFLWVSPREKGFSLFPGLCSLSLTVMEERGAGGALGVA